ncbi:MAG: YceD family protein [Dissulfuribacterales bacterium]
MTKKTKEFRNTVLVEDIPEYGLHLIFEDMPGLLSGIEECRILGPVKGEVFLHRVDGDVHLKGKIAALIVLKCDRCLEEYNNKIDASFFYEFVPGQLTDKENEVTLGSKDMEVSFYNGAKIQIGEIFREQILLQIPMRHVCSEDCKGICPGCGAELNREKCRCRKATLENPFSVLKKLHEAAK